LLHDLLEYNPYADIESGCRRDNHAALALSYSFFASADLGAEFWGAGATFVFGGADCLVFSSSNNRIAGVQVSSYCPERTAQMNANKKHNAMTMLRGMSRKMTIMTDPPGG
jgi:hypothetical protein